MSSKNKLFSFLIVLSLINVILCDETKEVQLKQGLLAGKVEKTFWKQTEYFSFKGIPYAKPPTGELRFQPPKPHESWDGIYEAYENNPTCMQFSSRSRNSEPFGLSGSEDCLYLSVFTPELGGNLPVVVFDYNDNFRTGVNGTKTYSPDFFIEEGVIVVTITHRVGLFGYLTTEDDIIIGNNGIRDFILGLTWVRNNIARFGGDPSKVTLMGNRGGAALIDILLYSEKAKDLFTGAILQSGTVMEAIYFPNNARAKAFELGDTLDITTDDSKTLLEELQKVDAEKILLNEFKTFDNEGLMKYQRTVFAFTPIVEEDREDAVLKTLPEEGKIVNDVPIVIGLTSREGLDLASHFIFEPRMFQEVLNGFSMHFPIRAGFRFDRNSTVFNRDVAREINEIYYKDGYLHSGNILEYADYIGDTLQSYAIDCAAKKLVKDLESPVYYYMFDFRGVLNENSEHMAKLARFSFKNKGATVTDDLCYLHLCSRIKKNYQHLQKLVTEQPEIKVLKKMVRLWTNFAKTRNPTPDQEDKVLKGITWEPMDKGSKDAKYLHITKTFKMKKNPLGSRAEFWDQFLDKYSKLAVDGVVKDDDSVKDVDTDVEESKIIEADEIAAKETENKEDENEQASNEGNWDDVIVIPDRRDEL